MLFIAAAWKTKSKLNPVFSGECESQVCCLRLSLRVQWISSYLSFSQREVNVAVDASHKDLNNFTKRVVALTALEQFASTKGLGQNPDVTIARVKKKNQIGGVDVSPFALKMLGNMNFLAFGLDSGSDEEERESTEDQGEDSLDLNAINFLSRSVRTRSGRVISLSHRALAWYQLLDQYFFERSL